MRGVNIFCEKLLCTLEAVENVRSPETGVTWTARLRISLCKRTRRDVVEAILFSYLQSARAFGSSLKNENDVHTSVYPWHRQSSPANPQIAPEIIMPARSFGSSLNNIKEICMLPSDAVIVRRLLKFHRSDTQMVPQSSSSSSS